MIRGYNCCSIPLLTAPIACVLQPHLVGTLPDPRLGAAEHKDGPLSPWAAVGRPHGKVAESVLVHVAQAG